MTSLRKKAAAWFLGLTALAISAIGGSFVILRDELPTDPAFVETHLEASRNFDVSGARKANYSDQEIAAFVVKANQAEFDRQWYRLLSIISILYLVLALGIGATTLRTEASAPGSK